LAIKKIGLEALASGALSWAGKGFWAVTDQALFAGTNFLVNILLARWLEPAAYGAFATGYAVFLLVGTLHTALWTEPMLVYGSGRYREVFPAYQSVLLRYHWRFGLGVFLGFAALGIGFGKVGQGELSQSFLGLSLSAPALLYLWLVRRGAYVLLDPRRAALAGGLYLFLYLGLVAFLLRQGLLNVLTALLAMALAALLAAEAIRFRLRAGRQGEMDPLEIRTLHWSYGRWALLAAVLAWVPGNFYVLALSAFSGSSTAGEFKVLSTLLMPVVYFNSSMMQIFLPLLSRSMTGEAGIRRIALSKIQFALQGFWGLMWGGIVCFGGNRLIAMLFGGKYLFEDHVFFMLFVSSIALGVITGFSTLLRAANFPNLLSAGWFISALLTVLLGVILLPYGGLNGALLSSMLVNLAGVFVMAFISRGVVK
jgi:O-antigen/teichoic acid export membrane protein